MIDDAMGIYPLTERNRGRLGGCQFTKTVKDERLNADVFIFNNPYRKTNIDVVFYKDKFFVSDSYGESMEREAVCYVPFGAM